MQPESILYLRDKPHVGPKIMVMLIDDQAMVGEAVRRILADQEDIDLHYCSDAQLCTEHAEQIRPTVILLDLVMPNIDGLEVARLFRSNPTTANIPIVMLSTTEEPQAKSQAFAAGADDYLVKLPDKIELVARIRYHSKSYLNLLQRDEAYRALRESQQQLLDTNTKLTALNQAFLQAKKEVEQVNQALHAEIAERQMAMEALREAVESAQQAKEEADMANRAKSEFLSRMSHELRTPLNAILGFGQLLEMDKLTPPQQESVEQILNGGRHLLNLINEILDIARIEAGRLSLSSEPVQVSEVVREALNLIQPLSDQFSVRLHRQEAAVCDNFVLADRQRLKQVLLNLLSNAVKYNHPGGSVRCLCQLNADTLNADTHNADSVARQSTQAQSKSKLDVEIRGTLRISITDSGPGIAAADLDRLFTPFERLKAEETAIEGTGLGLALSKRLIELMNGSIGVESTPTEGSTFWIELPIADGPAEQLQRNGDARVKFDHNADPTREHCVLYIEDNLPNLRLIEHILDQCVGIHLISAMQGSIGLDLARQHRPSLILLDLHLPDMTGVDVLRHLKDDAQTRDIPVIIISADATAGQIQRLRASGATEYLTKPLDVQGFLRVLEENIPAT